LWHYEHTLTTVDGSINFIGQPKENHCYGYCSSTL